MKHYFKYASGYVNIDSENLYLTNSGNWQEARELKEKSPATIRKNNTRLTGINIFLYLVFGGAAAFIFFALSNKLLSVGLIVGVLALAYKVNETFKQEQGKRYKIPLSKIESIEVPGGEELCINFRNENNEPDSETINGLDLKGIDVLAKMGLITTTIAE